MAKKQTAEKRAENEVLYAKLFDEDGAVRAQASEQMVLNNLALANSYVSQYLRAHPGLSHLADEFYSAIYLAVVEAVSRMANGERRENPRPAGLIYQYVRRAVMEVLEHSEAIRVPGRTFRRKKSADPDFRRPSKEGSLAVEHTLARDGARDPRALVDLMEEIIGSCVFARERRLIQLRLDGRSDIEIGVILNISRSAAYMMRRGIYTRFLDRNPEYRV